MPDSQIANKWLKTNVLLNNPRIARHIPETRKYTAGGLQRMLSKYGGVVLKPVVGTGGQGVIMVEKSKGGYHLRYRDRKYWHGGYQALVSAFNRIRMKRSYLIQQRIHLAKIHGRPLDYRVKIVKKDGKWVITAVVGRLARKGLFITNLCQGGTQLMATQSIRQSLSAAQVKPKRKEMCLLTYLSKDIFEQRFPGVRRLGFDYGIDRNGKIWMFELNTRPH